MQSKTPKLLEDFRFEAIRTLAECQAVLKEIESLMLAKAGSPEGERLEHLVALVEAWERQHLRMESQ